MTWIIVVVAFLLALLGTPLFAVLALGALVAFWTQDIGSASVSAEMVRLATSPVLIAIPLFTFAGYLFSESKTPQRLVRLTRAAFGWVPGGLALVAMVACALFTAFTGASGVTIVAMGGLLMPALLKDGFSPRFSLGLLTTSGSLGLLFPPSLPLILYSYVASTSAGGMLTSSAAAPSVDRLFLAGILPGIFLIGALAVLSVRQGVIQLGGRVPFRWGELWSAFREGAWEVPLPFIILGGIYGGKLTVTEAASVTALYALIVEVFIYRDIPLNKLSGIVRESMTLVGGILVILAAALGLTNFLVDAEVPLRILDGIRGLVTSRLAFLMLLNAFLLVVGCLMDIFSALIVVVPLIIPIAQEYDVNLIHLGIIFLANLEIGYMTPPVGLNLFISSYRFQRPVVEVYRSTFPFLITLLIALLVITYWPDLSLFLPRLFGGG
ncbi:MAG: TRAP transporter large permease subunit [Candidatus Eisenbacteria bacterium]|uniref:TRAP transporter large permease subunit n=1 Tax=Eiseniibacteriota bacterium TaxID=2212470 RepID=A0A948RUW5_UNCEI|nr:TRAP transporter large permease subunit [Candidatus Eisenbacteria bacterium]MBU1948671.1 TRAP transporter large permease subunit [Candidatus Eisenbacteria bacterium]MBU2690981.1 TRAP transporter large permease subunit [Candidatus Eisenbacteria bacterium]